MTKLRQVDGKGKGKGGNGGSKGFLDLLILELGDPGFLLTMIPGDRSAWM